MAGPRRACARSYQGPFDAARLALVEERLAVGWLATTLPDEVPPTPNWALRRVLLASVEDADSAGETPADPARAATRLVDPTKWSLVSRLLGAEAVGPLSPRSTARSDYSGGTPCRPRPTTPNRLWATARQSPSRRFQAIYERVHSP